MMKMDCQRKSGQPWMHLIMEVEVLVGLRGWRYSACSLVLCKSAHLIINRNKMFLCDFLKSYFDGLETGI